MSELQKQIRIGNYLLGKCVDDLDERKEWWETYQIKDADDFLGIKEGWDKPIPLTEEFLIKIGFHRIHGLMRYFLSFQGRFHYIFKDGGVWWYIFEIDGKDIKVNQTGLLYAHQLQNLYHSLTGEELEIKRNEPNATI